MSEHSTRSSDGLPPAPRPRALRARRVGDRLVAYTAGMTPRRDGELVIDGVVGDQIVGGRRGARPGWPRATRGRRRRGGGGDLDAIVRVWR